MSSLFTCGKHGRHTRTVAKVVVTIVTIVTFAGVAAILVYANLVTGSSACGTLINIYNLKITHQYLQFNL